MTTCAVLIVSLAMLGLSCPALADDANPDRPGIADGSSVVGASRFQVESGVQREQRHGGGQVMVDTGLAYVLTPDVQLDASVGRGVHGVTPPHRFASAGVCIRF